MRCLSQYLLKSAACPSRILGSQVRLSRHFKRRRLGYRHMMQKSEQIRFCKSRDGARIAYAVCGSGPPLVWATRWVHHLKFDWESPVWRPWLALLMRRHTLIRYDFRGCGLSDRERVEFSFDRYVEDLEAVVDAAGVDKFALFGMGNGGTIATVYAVRHPSRVTYLVLLGSSSRGRLRDPTQVRLRWNHHWCCPWRAYQLPPSAKIARSNKDNPRCRPKRDAKSSWLWAVVQDDQIVLRPFAAGQTGQ